MRLASEKPSKLRGKGFQLRILYPANLPIKYDAVLDMQGLKFTSHVPCLSEPLEHGFHQNENKIEEDPEPGNGGPDWGSRSGEVSAWQCVAVLRTASGRGSSRGRLRRGWVIPVDRSLFVVWNCAGCCSRAVRVSLGRISNRYREDWGGETETFKLQDKRNWTDWKY